MKQIIINCQTGEQTIQEITDIETPVKTEEELRQEYENLVVTLIRNNYSESEELALHRKKIAGLDTGEFDNYNTFVEECKTQAYNSVYYGGV